MGDTKDTTTSTAYCVPIDEVDPSIEETATLEIPLEGKYSPNKATNSLMRTVLNFAAFLVIILIATVIVPQIYQVFILDPINKAISLEDYTSQFHETAQNKLDALLGADVYSMFCLIFISIMLAIDGIINSNITSTIFSIFVVLFAVIAFGRIQMLKINEAEFIKSFTGENIGALDADDKTREEPSFSKVRVEAIGEFIISNIKYLFKGSVYLAGFILFMIIIITITFRNSSSYWLYMFIISNVCLNIVVFIEYLVTTYMMNKNDKKN
jgi:hypothetical protein